MNQLAPIASSNAPALVAAAGKRASYRFIEFFTAQIRNTHTRRAYARAATEFFDWLEAHGVTQITAIESGHVAAYVEQLQRARSAPIAKLRLAALRRLFDWMVAGEIMPSNPAAAVRGPRHIVRRGKTPALDPVEARQLIDAIDTSTVIGLRDRALIGLMIYSFARIGAAIGMRVEDVYPQNHRQWVRLHVKSGRQHAMPSQSRILSARIYRRCGPCERPEGASVPDLQPRDRSARRQSPAPGERVRDDPEASQGGRHRDQDRQPHVSGHGRHRVLEERRHP